MRDKQEEIYPESVTVAWFLTWSTLDDALFGSEKRFNS